MAKRAATPVRFDMAVADRLSAFVVANPGMSMSSAANRLADEALRMNEHPGIVFRPGPTGRRAGLVGGPDVWELVRAVKSAREQARSRGARKLSPRVLGGNAAARRLYESCGFTVEGVLGEEFFLDGRYIDDVLMACMPGAVAGRPGG